jgi:hypothetical protein
MTAIERIKKFTFFGLRFRNEKLFAAAPILMLVTLQAPETTPTDLIFWGIFVAAPSWK